VFILSAIPVNQLAYADRMPITIIHEIVLFIARQPAESDIVMANPSVRLSVHLSNVGLVSKGHVVTLFDDLVGALF